MIYIMNKYKNISFIFLMPYKMPKQLARDIIDKQLSASGCIKQNINQVNLYVHDCLSVSEFGYA